MDFTTNIFHDLRTLQGRIRIYTFESLLFEKWIKKKKMSPNVAVLEYVWTWVPHQIERKWVTLKVHRMNSWLRMCIKPLFSDVVSSFSYLKLGLWPVGRHAHIVDPLSSIPNKCYESRGWRSFGRLSWSRLLLSGLAQGPQLEWVIPNPRAFCLSRGSLVALGRVMLCLQI